MGMTMSEKILASHSGKRVVEPGEVVDCYVDVAVLVDGMGGGQNRPNRVWNPDKIYIVPDHLVPAPNISVANGLKDTREYASRLGLHYIGLGRHGISHQVIAERALALPGTLLACGDSHSSASGAFNCAARGLGGPDMLYVLCKGRTWFIVGPTIRFVVEGHLPDRVFPRDIVHYVAGAYGAFPGRNVEWVGETIHEITVSGRQTIATVSTELSAEFALFECDDILRNYLQSRTSQPISPVYSDPDARFEAVHRVDVSGLDPQVVLPHRVAHNVKPVQELAEVKIDQAFVGSCANARVEDLAVAAEIVKGREIASWVRFIVTPSSQLVYAEAVKRGYISTLVEAGAVVTNSTCGACFGGHLGVIGDGEVCITSSPRNFRGRMGSPQAEVYMGSPAVVAASAVRGYISDPRGF